MGLAAVESPQPAVGHDDPVGNPLVERRHDTRTGIFFGCVGVAQVRAVQPAIPGIDECRCERSPRLRRGWSATEWRATQEVVGLGLVRPARPVDGGLEAQLLEERFEQLAAKRLLVLAAPASLGVM